jgi:hypothetical protein
MYSPGSFGNFLIVPDRFFGSLRCSMIDEANFLKTVRCSVTIERCFFAIVGHFLATVRHFLAIVRCSLAIVPKTLWWL